MPECGFDGGDCCLEAPLATFDCFTCNCHLNLIPPFDPCKFFSDEVLRFDEKRYNFALFLVDCNVRDVWQIGDEYCDDHLNTYPCNFDGGDCCNSNNFMFANNYCTQCLCVWDKLNYPVVTTPNTRNKPTYFEFSLT